MELTVGAVLEGKIKSITNFGAFVSLPENKTGMVHISEVANAYVSDIRQHLTEGQEEPITARSICPSSVWSPSPSGRIISSAEKGASSVGKAAAAISSAGRAASRTGSSSPDPSAPLSSPLHPRRQTSCLKKS